MPLRLMQPRMQHKKWVRISWILGVLSLSLWTYSCSKPVPDIQVPPQSSETSDTSEPDSGPENKDSTSDSNSAQNPTPIAKPREIVYVAEKLDPEPGQLISNDPNSKINVRAKPTTQSKAKHYGLKGDHITLLQKAEGEGNYIWYYVRFDQSKAEGWIREDFIVSDEFLEAEGVVPFNYSGTYVSLPQTGPALATFQFKQARSQINFTVAADIKDCNPQKTGSAFFVPESNQFMGTTADGELDVTFIPQFEQGKFTGKMEVKTELVNASDTSSVACDYSGIYVAQ